ncbi:acyl-CoA N-acyltransferase [Gonapodya prolifera JEL478]|uniref:Acyl-CoA N-acyltransferase n=1 Tax=Gonapodya prolifera (strain JEL478) TaxID=1344416 RepID=A0A138ZXH1_GONPJ|nr:acyl-CoA N-acyltransferase [Gonapodya prolifera JEL478]|eukprot:KXS08833.1 acyl-CoA N-acyltransferase [Gonapodya prolifera JEL478]
MIRPTLPSDEDTLVSLGVSTGLFTEKEADALLRDTLKQLHAGSLPEGHVTYVYTESNVAPPMGWIYLAPEATDETSKPGRLWDLWWIGVAPARQGRGIGGKLLHFAEEVASKGGGVGLRIETSASEKLGTTRKFYTSKGYAEIARVKDAYGEGEDKIVFLTKFAERKGDHK